MSQRDTTIPAPLPVHRTTAHSFDIGDKPTPPTASTPASASLTTRAVQLWSAKLAAFALAVVLPLLLVRRLTIVEFGAYKQVFLLVSTAMAVVPMGFGMSAFYFLPREPDARRRAQVVFNVLLFMLLTSGAVSISLVSSPAILTHLFGNSSLEDLAPLVGATVILWVVGSFLDLAILSNGESRLAMTAILVAQLTRTGLLVASAVTFGTISAILWAAIAQGVVQVLFLAAYLRSRFGVFWRSFSLQLALKQVAYSLPLGTGAILLQLQLDLPQYFVSHEFGPAAYAVYAVGCFNIPLLSILAESANVIVLPRINELQGAGERRQIIEIITRMIRKQAAACFALTAFLLVYSREVITVLFTNQYLDARPLFCLNLAMLPLALISSGCDPVVRSYAEHRFTFLKIRLLLFVVLTLTLSMCVHGLTIFGILGLAIGVGALERLISGAVVWRILGLGVRDLSLFSDVAKLGFCACIAGLSSEVTRTATSGLPVLAVLGVGFLGFSLIYVLSAVCAGVPTAGEQAMLRPTALKRLIRGS